MKELLLCALKRRGRSATAGELYDEALSLAIGAGWPRRIWQSHTPRSAAALLKGMAGRGEAVREAGRRRENGADRPLWEPIDGYDADYPMPQEPDPAGEDHPLHGMTGRQKYVLFDALDNALQTHNRHHVELFELTSRHNRELGEVVARAKRELLAVGIKVGS